MLPQVRKYHEFWVYHHGLELKHLRPFPEVLMAQLPSGGLIAHSPGAGKTAIIAALFAQTPDDIEGRPQTNLVVVPSHIVHQWKSEINRFCPHLSCSIVTTESPEHIPRSPSFLPSFFFPFDRSTIKQ